MMKLHVKSLEFDHVNVHFGLKRTTKQARFQVNIDHWFNLSKPKWI